MDVNVLHDLKRIAELSRALTEALDKLFEDVSGTGKGNPVIRISDLLADGFDIPNKEVE